MNLNEYQYKATRTMSNLDGTLMNIIHMLLGIGTELGELQDQYKKHIAYGRKLDIVNVEEEIGDIMWYIANLCTVLNLKLETVLDQNIEKLEARYPEKFLQEKAENRDLDKERKVLEGKSQLTIISEPE